MSAGQCVVKKHGFLTSGFGREVPNSHSHGGTIFNDAATFIIWAENHISV